MRILYWIPRFWPDVGGIQSLATNLLPALQKRGHEIVVITSTSRLDQGDGNEYKGIPVRRFPFLTALGGQSPQLILSTIRQIRELKSSFQPQVVHLSFGLPSIAYFHLKTIEASPCSTLLTVHANLEGHSGPPGTLLGDILRKANWVTSDSNATLAEVHRICPELVQRSSVVTSGSALPAIAPEPLPFDPPTILCVGRIEREKGFDLVIEAYVSVLERFPNARLAIAGDGRNLPDLEKLALASGVHDRVKFTGSLRREEVSAFVNTGTIVVIPSRVAESFPMVAIEAAQMGRPIVATRLGGLPEAVADGVTGILVASEDSRALAEAVISLLNNQAKTREMGRTAQHRALKLFNWERYVDDYEALYQKLVVAK